MVPIHDVAGFQIGAVATAMTVASVALAAQRRRLAGTGSAAGSITHEPQVFGTVWVRVPVPDTVSAGWFKS